MVRRQVINIDEEKCNGCGLCISPCVEGAIKLENGKAKVISDTLCDGAGVCLTSCPQGALSLVEKEAPQFDEAAAAEHLKIIRAEQKHQPTLHCYNCNSNDEQRPLIAFSHQGKQQWVCVRCLPNLIHG